jgi:putative FmdB family regulatory protein
MPIFEFVCSECGSSFEELVRSATVVDEVICPSCGSSDTKKQISAFTSRINGGGVSLSTSRASGAGCSSGSV